MIYLGSDHRGFNLKNEVKQWLTKKGVEFDDIGTDSDESVDYPLIAKMVGTEVSSNDENRGVLICGGGAGVCIAANKVKGVRAYQAWNENVSKAGRNDDDVNVLCLAADHQTMDEVKPILERFFSTPFESVERRVRRLGQIKDIEESK